jgi:hypothetical protein
MSLISIPYRNLSMGVLDKTAIESIYSKFAITVGGSYYSSGGAVGPVSGTLDWRNFAHDAGINLQNRSEVYSYSVLSVLDPLQNVATPNIFANFTIQCAPPFPSSPYTARYPMTIAGLAICVTGLWTAVTGSIAVNQVNNSSTTPRFTIALTNYTPGTLLTNTSASAFKVYPGDYITVAYTYTSNTGGTGQIRNAYIGLLMKTPLVK